VSDAVRIQLSHIRFLNGCAELVHRIGGLALNVRFAARGAQDFDVVFSHVPQKSRERMRAAVANNVDGFLRHT
jgi:hypothetical protein